MTTYLNQIINQQLCLHKDVNKIVFDQLILVFLQGHTREQINMEN